MQHRKEKLTFSPLFLGMIFLGLLGTNPGMAAPSKVVSKKASPSSTPSPTPPLKKKPLVISSLPHEYGVYFQAKAILSKKQELATIESTEKYILLSRMESDSKVLEKELDEYFYALELRRAEKLVKQKSWDPASKALARGLGGLSTFRWIYYWNENTSQALFTLCTHQKAVKMEEACQAMVKRVIDAFPKAAIETKMLRDLPLTETITAASEVSGDRLSQAYSEKMEKDEEAFQEVLAAFVGGYDHDLKKSAEQFIEAYPKSLLRFRAMFMMAEMHFRKNDKKEAKELYQKLVDQIPLSFYAIVSAERLDNPLRNKVKKDALKINTDLMNLSEAEKKIWARAEFLLKKKHEDEVAFEMDSFMRIRSYTDDTLLSLVKLSSQAHQSLSAFRFANEFVQRRYSNLLSADFLAWIFPEHYQKEIETQAALYKLDPLLILSLMKQESGFRAQAVSSSGALGLMQIMPFTALDTKKDMHLAELRNAAANIAVGTKYLASLMVKYNGNAVFALAAYNAGPHRVAKWRKDAKPDVSMIEFIESIPFKETRDYVLSILRNRYWYQYRKGLPNQSMFSVWVAAEPTNAAK